MESLFDGSLTSLVAGAAISIVSLNIIFALFKSFKRDSIGNSFGNVVTGSVSLLQNRDSVLKREEVKDSMDGYDNLFAGARKDVGSLHSKESIEKRQKEYQTMVNSFYNLVTDFYEWGWGQVRVFFWMGYYLSMDRRNFSYICERLFKSWKGRNCFLEQ